jgi:predicted nucleic acid-binding protein
MTLVVDSSALVASLVSDDSNGLWAQAAMRDEALVAPTHVHVEASNALRRLVVVGLFPRDLAALVHAELSQVSIRTFRFESLAARVWELHPTVTAYDAAYVALAEELGAPLMTLDRRLARASGPRCEFLLPPE